MFLLDDILMLPLRLPVAGFNWIMRQIQTMANEELLDDTPWKERLVELHMLLELGEISEGDYAVEEQQVFAALRAIRARREEIAREAAAAQGEEEPESGIGIYTGYGK
ncbi:MAG TPA: gas vesicle protein GvpG [Thermoanaerobaculia bacterium]|nr:gas vesicle protein GvpG [Thermoanaerobaculia bacterium]